jgi:MFS family permease
MLTGACCFGGAVALFAVITELWQLYLVYLLMAVGAASMHVGAISMVVGQWFDHKRGLALSLALNGASSGGILVTPVLVLAIAHYGFSNAMFGSALVMAVVLAAGDRAVDRPPGGRGHAGRRRARCSRLEPAKRAAQHGILERGGAVCDGAHRAGRLFGASDRDPRTRRSAAPRPGSRSRR